MLLTEDQLLLREGQKIVEALGKTLAPLVEVVLHDLTRPDHAITAIANNLSGRAIGEPASNIGLARILDPAFPEVLQNYPSQFADGRPAKSTSIGLKNSQGRFVAAICLNMDTSQLAAVSNSLTQLIQTEHSPLDHAGTPARTRIDAIQSALEHFAASRNTTPRGMTVAQRREAISALAANGLLLQRNAVADIAQMLGVARSTVYTYLPPEGDPP